MPTQTIEFMSGERSLCRELPIAIFSMVDILLYAVKSCYDEYV